jgi:hypothetical protein
VSEGGPPVIAFPIAGIADFNSLQLKSTASIANSIQFAASGARKMGE